jgi:hypothetical protein
MAMETGGSIGFPVGDTYVYFFVFWDLIIKKKLIFFRIQPTSGRKLL